MVASEDAPRLSLNAALLTSSKPTLARMLRPRLAQACVLPAWTATVCVGPYSRSLEIGSGESPRSTHPLDFFMKIHLARCRFFLVGLLMFAVAMATAVRSAEGTPSPPNAAAPNFATVMRTTYLALVNQSIVPADPRVVGIAALEAMAAHAPDHGLSLPAAFGVDAETDANWLAASVAHRPVDWSVIEAMARQPQIAHMGLGTPEMRLGVGALMRGEPLMNPGFNIYRLADGRFAVWDLVKGASADTSGVRVGDVLLSINGKRTARVDALTIYRFTAGSEVTLEIERAQRVETIKLSFTKTSVPIVTSRMLDDGLGYVLVRGFARSKDPEFDTPAQARQAFTNLSAAGARGLILDFRSTLGGSGVDKMVSALSDGEIMYSLQKPGGAPRPIKRDGERCWPDRPIVVLINEETVSAPEYTALALRELAKARIVGQRSGGGLTEISVVPLGPDYVLTIPGGAALGPISGAAQPNYALKPDVEISNPTIDEMIRGEDRQLDAARALFAPRPEP